MSDTLDELLMAAQSELSRASSMIYGTHPDYPGERFVSMRPADFRVTDCLRTIILALNKIEEALRERQDTQPR